MVNQRQTFRTIRAMAIIAMGGLLSCTRGKQAEVDNLHVEYKWQTQVRELDGQIREQGSSGTSEVWGGNQPISTFAVGSETLTAKLLKLDPAKAVFSFENNRHNEKTVSLAPGESADVIFPEDHFGCRIALVRISPTEPK